MRTTSSVDLPSVCKNTKDIGVHFISDLDNILTDKMLECLNPLASIFVINKREYRDFSVSQINQWINNQSIEAYQLEKRIIIVDKVGVKLFHKHSSALINLSSCFRVFSQNNSNKFEVIKSRYLESSGRDLDHVRFDVEFSQRALLTA